MYSVYCEPGPSLKAESTDGLTWRACSVNYVDCNDVETTNSTAVWPIGHSL